MFFGCFLWHKLIGCSYTTIYDKSKNCIHDHGKAKRVWSRHSHVTGVIQTRPLIGLCEILRI